MWGDCTFYSNVLKRFETVTSEPTLFLKSQETLEPSVKSILKDIYDVTKKTENSVSETDSLSQLLIDNFDTEQIWQQLELHNGIKFDKYNETVSRILKKSRTLHKICTQITGSGKCNSENTNEKNESNNSDDEGSSNFDEAISDDEEESSDADEVSSDADEVSNDADEVSSDANGENYTDDNENDEDEYSEKENNSGSDNKIKSMKTRTSIVDDDFFKLSEMEAAVLSAEKNDINQENKDDLGLYYYPADLNKDDKNDELAINAKYSDLFREPDKKTNKNGSEIPKKKVRFQLESTNTGETSESDEEKVDLGQPMKKDDADKSSYEKRKERIDKRIEDLEEEIIAEKPWQMKGEILAKKRPQNSLLEEVLEFNLTTRPAPVITEEVTLKLEDIIIRRIKDKAWDDVERKIKPVDTPYEFKKKLILNQEKSKLSLAEIYEKEYLQKREEISGNKTNQTEEEPAEHRQLKTLIDLLFKKLDALSNYHFTPMPVAPKVEIINNLPAISMEEAAPVAVSDATLLAPEEIQEKSKGAPISKEERTAADKNRERKRKKLRQRERRKEIEKREKLLKRLNTGMGNKYSKMKIEKELDQLGKMKNVDKLEEKSHKKNISSKSFFGMLDEVSKSGVPDKRKKSKTPMTKAKRLKTLP